MDRSRSRNQGGCEVTDGVGGCGVVGEGGVGCGVVTCGQEWWDDGGI